MDSNGSTNEVLSVPNRTLSDNRCEERIQTVNVKNLV